MSAEHTEGKAPRLPLTRRQREVLDFVVSYLETHGYAPKYEEIGEMLGIGRATVAEHVQQLEARGAIAHRPREARSIVPLERGEQLIVIPARLSESGALRWGKHAVEEARSITEAQRSLEFVDIFRLSGCRDMVLHLVDEVGETESKLKQYTWQGHWREGQKPRSFSFGEGIAGVVWATKKAYVSRGDVRDNDLYIPSERVEEGGVRSLLAVPMLDARERCVGVFSLGSPVAGWFQERLGERVENLEVSSNLLLQVVTSKMHLGLESSVDSFLLGFRAAISGDIAASSD